METTKTTETVNLYRITFLHRIPVTVWAASHNEALGLVYEDNIRFSVTGVEIVEE